MLTSVQWRAAAGSARLAVALWLYANLAGVNSLRAIPRLALKHEGYFWICGGVVVDHRTVSDCRGANVQAFESLLKDSLAEWVVSIWRVVQDAARIRVSAGDASFNRGATLQGCLFEAPPKSSA